MGGRGGGWGGAVGGLGRCYRTADRRVPVREKAWHSSFLRDRVLTRGKPIRESIPLGEMAGCAHADLMLPHDTGPRPLKGHVSPREECVVTCGKSEQSSAAHFRQRLRQEPLLGL